MVGTPVRFVPDCIAIKQWTIMLPDIGGHWRRACRISIQQPERKNHFDSRSVCKTEELVDILRARSPSMGGVHCAAAHPQGFDAEVFENGDERLVGRTEQIERFNGPESVGAAQNHGCLET